MINVLLAGGSGTRLWPLSRKKLPKQFVRMFSGASLFQKTLMRNQSLVDDFLCVANKEHFYLALDQSDCVLSSNITFLNEPVGRNTAPAIALACMQLDPGETVLITTSDHLIKDQNAYEKAVNEARLLAEQNYLVTFGIQPTFPETGFGYISYKNNDVLSFKEKPTIDLAESYLLDGGYLWNSGMFCFKAGVFLEELKKYSPIIYEKCEIAFSSIRSEGVNVLDIPESDMLSIPENSVDYAVMEHSERVKVIPCDIGWSDMGSFDAIYEEMKEPNSFNAVITRGDKTPEPILVDSTNNLVITDHKLVCLVGVEDMEVIETSDAILIVKRGKSQDVKQVVNELKSKDKTLLDVHRKAYRPWGWYDNLQESERFKVKRIMVEPGASLSLQKHNHRAEHWVVVSGTAEILCGDSTFTLHENMSTFIPLGIKHRLTNPGVIPLELIEVQSGSYLGEDDIVRFEDKYGR